MTNHYHCIANLIYQYANLVDAGDFEALGALFEKGRIIYMPSGFEVKGGQSMTDHFVRSVRLYPETGTPCTLHQVTNVAVDFADNDRRASASSVFTVYQFAEGQPWQTICAGRYYDQFVFDKDRWNFHERSVEPCYFGDMSRHIVDLEPVLRPVFG